MSPVGLPADTHRGNPSIWGEPRSWVGVREGHRSRTRRCRGEDGTSLVAMAFMVAPLCLLLFGIVVYGYLMSFRQNMTQAAAEGARAGAIAPPDASPTSHTIAISQATVATRQALQSFGKDCDNVSTTCVVNVDDCATTETPP